MKRIVLFISGLIRRKTIVSACEWGLSNRIKCLVSSMRWAKRLHANVVLDWPQNEHCRCDFSELFSNRFSLVNEEEFARQGKRGAASSQKMLFKIPDLIAFPGELPVPKEKRQYGEPGPSISLMYEKIPQKLRRDFLVYFNSLIPAADLKREAELFSERFPEETAGIHIRSWIEARDTGNFGHWTTNAAKAFSMDRVYAAIDRRKNNVFFVCADDQAIVDELRKRYQGRILHHPKSAELGDRGSPQAIREALVDLLLLSRCRTILGSGKSSFPEVAWWLGGCKARFEALNFLE